MKSALIPSESPVGVEMEGKNSRLIRLPIHRSLHHKDEGSSSKRDVSEILSVCVGGHFLNSLC